MKFRTAKISLISAWPSFAAVLLMFSSSLAAENYSQWNHSTKITFNTTATGANVAAAVTNFRMFIRFVGTPAQFAQMQSNGGDIRFADPDGTQLNFQIEHWDSAAARAEMWVRVPQVDGNSDKDYITMYWGNPAAPWVSDGTKVFTSGGGYRGVWHLSEGSTGTRFNSAGTTNHAVPKNYDGNESQISVLGKGDVLDGANPGNYLDLGEGFSDFGRGFTYTVWANLSGTTGWERLLDIGTGSAGDNIIFSRNATSNDLSFQAYEGKDLAGHLIATGGLPNNQWVNLGVTVYGKDVVMYENGVKIYSGSLSSSLNNVLRKNNYIGRSNWPSDGYLKGELDEPEISDVIRTADWIKLSYETQKPKSTAVIFSGSASSTPLSIIDQPASQSATEGGPVNFKVTVASGASLTFQWYKDGKAVSDWSQRATLVIPVVHISDAGSYTVKITDGQDTLTSQAAMLTIAENYALWSKSEKIFFNTTPGGANVPGSVLDFPMLVRLDGTRFDFSGTSASHKDIRFADADGTRLAFQVATWDSAAKRAEIWVRVPEVKGNSDQDYITMYWGKSDAVSVSSSTQVFSSENGFRAVWQMDDAGGGSAAATVAVDATANGFNGTAQGPAWGKPGQVGTAFEFNGGTHRVEVPLAATDGLKTFTFSFWAKETTAKACPAGSWECPSMLGMETGGSASSDMWIVSSNGKLVLVHGLAGGANDITYSTNISLNDGAWHFIAATDDGQAIRLYEAGTQLTTLNLAAGAALASRAFDIGNNDWSDNTHTTGFTGGIDAVQLSGTARSSDWIKLAYETQKTSSTALVFGQAAETPIPAPYADPPAGTYVLAPSIQLTCALDGAHIYYTLDGSLPDSTKPSTFFYQGPFLLNKSATLTAIAFLNGRAGISAVMQYLIPSGPSKSGDTLAPGGQTAVGGGRLIHYLPQDQKADVVVAAGPEWNAPPPGFDHVGPPFTVASADTALPFPSLFITPGLDTTRGIELYQWGDLNGATWMQPQDGLLMVPAPGVYFWGRDTLAPLIRFLDAKSQGTDSMKVSFTVDDNIRNPQCRLRFWREAPDSTAWQGSTSGDTVTFLIPVPDSAATPLEVRFTATDNTNLASFPGRAGFTYTIGRPLPARACPVALGAGLAWTLAGMPIHPDNPVSLKSLASANGGGNIYGALWKKEIEDYVLLKDDDTLPVKKGFWLASDSGVKRLQVPAGRSISSDTDGQFNLKLTTGWNLVTCPSLKPVPWPVRRSDGEAYLHSPLKGLQALGETDYIPSDTLQPWVGYFAYYYGSDTIIKVGGVDPAKNFSDNSGNGVAKAGLKKSGAASTTIGLRLGDGRGMPLELGAAAWAGEGLGPEDEFRPPPLTKQGSIWLSREGRALSVDYVRLESGGVLRWTLMGRGNPAGYGVNLLANDLPKGWQVWAVSPARRVKYRLDQGAVLPLAGEDTLTVYSGAPEVLAKIGDLKNSLDPGAFRYRLRANAGRIELAMTLPTSADVHVNLWSPMGKKIGGLDLENTGAGSHAWIFPSAASGRTGMLPPALYLVEISVHGPEWRSHRTEKMTLMR